jgi:hypothetical protein
MIQMCAGQIGGIFFVLLETASDNRTGYDGYAICLAAKTPQILHSPRMCYHRALKQGIQ